MARVTVEDCVTEIPNRFELVMLASQRARDVSAGADLLVERDNDKNPVVALREIAEREVEPEHLRELLIGGLQRHAETDEPEEEAMELSGAGSDLLGEIERFGVEGMQVVGAAEAGMSDAEDAARPEPGEVLDDGDD